MKRKVLFGLGVLVLATVLTLNVTFVLRNNGQSTNLSLKSLGNNAMAQGEVIYCPNFKSADIWIPDGWIAGDWITCCVNGRDIDACAFSLEDEACAAKVTRASHEGC